MGDEPETEWLTYDEAAKRLGILPDSVRRRAASRKWPRRQGNDRKARVGIPSDAIPDSTPDVRGDDFQEIIALKTDNAALKAQLAGVEDRLRDTQQERDRWRDQAERLAESRQPVVGILGRIFGRG